MECMLLVAYFVSDGDVTWRYISSESVWQEDI